MFPNGFWTSSIWKEAARAGLRQISKMVSQGNLAGASQLAKTPGVLKPSLAGSQIQHLGRGGEGLATMVAHPEHGVAVRKLYDPRGVSGPEMIARKEQAGIALRDNPNFARFLGSAQTPSGGQMHFNEYISPGQAPTGQAGAKSIQHATVQSHKGLTEAGFAGGKDIRAGNMIYDANSGKHKVIDYLPAQKGEFLRMPKSRERVLAPASGSGPLNQAYNPQQADETGGMIGRLIGGRPSRPPVSPVTTGRRVGDMAVDKTVPAQPRTVAARPGFARGTPAPIRSVSPQASTIPMSPGKTSVMPKPRTPQPATVVL